MSSLTIVGLGPGSPDYLTRAADAVLNHADTIWVPSERRPNVDLLDEPRRLIKSLPPADPALSTRESIEALARQIVTLTRPGRDVVFAVRGNPLADEPVVPIVVELARTVPLQVTIVPGVSLAAAAADALGFDPAARGAQALDPRVVSGDIANLATTSATPDDPFRGVYRLLDPTRPSFLGPIDAPSVLAIAQRLLASELPGDHAVLVARLPVDGARASVARTTVEDLAGTTFGAETLFVYVDAIDRLSDLRGFDTLRYIVARLRGPGGCPWDRQQTYQSMKQHLIEEPYEAVAALDDSDLERFAEELGDVLLQVVMYGQFGREAGDFTLEDIFSAVNAKLIRRHPHVFGDVTVGDSAEVLKNWERIKRGERATGPSSFGGLPEATPALMRAAAILGRAERYGFPVDRLNSPSATDSARSRDGARTLADLGDSLLAAVVAARGDRLDPEEALRLATNRLRDALDRILSDCQDRGVDFASLPSPERLATMRAALSATSP